MLEPRFHAVQDLPAARAWRGRCGSQRKKRTDRSRQPAAQADDRSVIDALRAGALGYLTKDAGAAEIQQALHRVAGGQAALDPAVQRHLVEAIAQGGPGGPIPPAPP